MKKILSSIKYFIPLVVAGGLLTLIIVSGLLTYTELNSNLEKSNIELRNSVEENLVNRINNEINTLTMTAKLLLNDEIVLQLFSWKDRLSLQDHLLQFYENELKKQFGIKQFQFHTPPATSFLRLHKVSKYGDDLSSFRKTVVEANEKKTVVSGIEVGRGGLGLRIVHPINYFGDHLGSLEFGSDFPQMIESIIENKKMEYAIGVYDKVFEDAKRFENKETDVKKGNLVFYDFSSNETKSTINEIVISDEINHISKNDKDYMFFSVPLKDYSNNEIGVIIFIKDETDVIAANNTKVFYELAPPVFLGFLIIMSIIIIMNKRLVVPLDNFVEYTKNLTKGNYNAKQPEVHFENLQMLNGAMNELTDKISEQYQMLENLPTPVIKIDKDFNIQYANLATSKVLGVNRREINNKKCYDYFKTEHCNTEKCAVAQAMKQNKTIQEQTIARPNDQKLSVMYTGTPISDRQNEIIGGLEAFVDITEMKERENYLQRSTETLLGAMENFAHGDLTTNVKAEKSGDAIAELFDGFNKTVSNIKDIILRVKDAVEATASASTEISSSAEQMAAGSHEQSSQTAEVATAMEEMSRTVVETASNATVSAEASQEASKKAIEGASKVELSKEGMGRIVASTKTVGNNITSLTNKSEQIGEIAQVIDDIADQTNLLALNAAIEAARAGEHGRGFAVVADEVRKLAENTTKATKEIADTIRAIQTEAKDADSSMKEAGEAVQNGLSLNEEVGEVLNTILSSIENVTSQIGQVAAASEEQSATAEQVTSNIEAINNVANESAAGVQQIASASEDLNRLTENLSSLVQQFKIEENKNYEDHQKGNLIGQN
jgi:PAS domain S-box-containing protein